jgi:Fanconi anemia group M protein
MEFLEKIIPRDYQKNILKSCIEKNCLVVLPTGLGKTLIALMLTIERMKKFPGQKVIFLAPTKPLIEQHLKYFQKHLPELFADMQLFTGQINSKKRKEIFNTADIIFSTPQCIANDLKKELYKLENVCLLIEDEAHRCVKNYDYNYIAKRYKSQSSENFRILGLTASPGSNAQKIKQICQNLSIEEVEVKTRESEDVKKYIQKREFEKIEVNLPSEFIEMRHLLFKIYNSYIEELKIRKVLFGPVNKTILLKLQKEISETIQRGNKNFNYFLAASACAQAIKIQHAIELLETQTLKGLDNYLKKLFSEAKNKKSKGIIKLVAKQEFNFVYMKSNELIYKKQEHPKINEVKNILLNKISSPFKIIIISQFRDTAQAIYESIKEIPGIKPKVFIGQSKKNEKGISQKEQKKIIKEFSFGEINVLCATCIAEEGLDIPEVSAVIFYEPIPSAIRTIQRAGRTARLNKGKLIILMTKDTRDEINYYISRTRERKMGDLINRVKENMKKEKHQTIKYSLETNNSL